MFYCLTKSQPAVLLGGLLKAFDEKSLRNSLITNKYTFDLVQLQITFTKQSMGHCSDA